MYRTPRKEIRQLIKGSKMNKQLKFDPWMEIQATGYNFSTRLKNCLGYIYIRYVGQLVVYTEAELLLVTSFGKKSLIEVKTFLETLGARLGMQEEELQPFIQAKNLLKSCDPDYWKPNRYVIFPSSYRHESDDLSRYRAGVLYTIPIEYVKHLYNDGYETLGQIALAPIDEIEKVFEGDSGCFEFFVKILKRKGLELGTKLPKKLMAIEPYSKVKRA